MMKTVRSRRAVGLVAGLFVLPACSSSDSSNGVCSRNQDCDQGEICVLTTGECAAVCDRHQSCVDGELCLSGHCSPAPACSESVPCPGDAICIEGTCVAPAPPNGACSHDIQCIVGYCDLDTTRTCRVRSPGDACVSDRECSHSCQALRCDGCGDGRVEPQAGEACDDGAAALDDGCDAECQLEPGFGCSGSPSTCFPVIFVRADASPGGDGLTWDGAFATLTQAMVALAARPQAEIWLAAGTYTPGGSGLSFTVPLNVATVKVVGGFAGNESLREQRSVAEHLSILSGDNGGNDSIFAFDDNSLHVLHLSSAASVMLDGVVITAGRAKGERDDAQRTGDGGGILLEAGMLELHGCTVRGNWANATGGGIAQRGGTLLLGGGTKIAANSATYGGGLSIGDQATIDVLGLVDVEENEASLGGGIHLSPGAVLHAIWPLRITGNRSLTGGGVWMDEADVALTGAEIEGNEAVRAAGIYCEKSILALVASSLKGNTARGGDGGALFLEEGSTADLTDVSVVLNEANNGGGVHCASSSLTMRRSYFAYNYANVSGGGVADRNCISEFSDSSFRLNSAMLGRGGAIDAVLVDQKLTMQGCVVDSNSSAEVGGGAAIYAGPDSATTVGVDIRDSSFTGNASRNGAGLDLSSITEGANANPLEAVVGDTSFVDNVAAGDGGGLRQFSRGSLKVANCVFSGNKATNGGGAHLNGGCTLVSSRFERNSAETGGAVYAKSATAATNLVLANNEAEKDGGALWVDSEFQLVNSLVVRNRAEALGGGVATGFNGDVRSLFSTIADNKAASGSQVAAFKLTLFGTIVAGPSETIPALRVPFGWGAFYLLWSVVDGPFVLPDGPGNATEGLVAADPQFVNPGASDYTLRAGSPAIDSIDLSVWPADEHDIDWDGNRSEPLPVQLADISDLDGDGDVSERLPVDLLRRSRAASVTSPPLADMGAFELRP